VANQGGNSGRLGEFFYTVGVQGLDEAKKQLADFVNESEKKQREQADRSAQQRRQHDRAYAAKLHGRASDQLGRMTEDVNFARSPVGRAFAGERERLSAMRRNEQLADKNRFASSDRGRKLGADELSLRQGGRVEGLQQKLDFAQSGEGQRLLKEEARLRAELNKVQKAATGETKQFGNLLGNLAGGKFQGMLGGAGGAAGALAGGAAVGVGILAAGYKGFDKYMDFENYRKQDAIKNVGYANPSASYQLERASADRLGVIGQGQIPEVRALTRNRRNWADYHAHLLEKDPNRDSGMLGGARRWLQESKLGQWAQDTDPFGSTAAAVKRLGISGKSMGAAYNPELGQRGEFGSSFAANVTESLRSPTNGGKGSGEDFDDSVGTFADAVKTFSGIFGGAAGAVAGGGMLGSALQGGGIGMFAGAISGLFGSGD
jgi:hypothetical protein